jgi:hypothetical protein
MSDLKWETKKMCDPMEETSRSHNPRVHCSSHNPSKRIPALRIKPIPELVNPVAYEILRRPIIKPGIELVDDTFKPDNRENANQDGHHTDDGKNDDPKHW